MSTKRKLKLPIKTYLLILVLTASMVTGMSFAKFSTTVSGSDSISLAKYAIELELLDDTTPINLALNEMKPGDTQQYTIKVTNDKDGVRSDLALDFYLEIITDATLPLDIQLQENWENGNTFSPDAETHKIVSDLYNLEISAIDPLEFILTIAWPSNENDDIYHSLTNTITINLYWEQTI